MLYCKVKWNHILLNTNKIQPKYQSCKKRKKEKKEWTKHSLLLNKIQQAQMIIFIELRVKKIPNENENYTASLIKLSRVK